MTTTFIDRVFSEPEQSYFLFGPRGTGKSMLLRHMHKKAYFLDLLRAEIRGPLSAYPDQLIEQVEQQSAHSVIVIDEIQKIPELLSAVHILIEKKHGWKFILTGSSARKLRRQGVNLLGGRAVKKNLHPFMACELGEGFNLDEALQYGLLPLRFGTPNPYETLMGYISLYLDEEVKNEGLIRKYEFFTRFLSVMSFSHAAVLNVTNIARECYVKRTTVNDWITILQDLLVCHQMTIFSHKAKRELSAHPKFYFFDTGVYRALRALAPGDNESEINGPGLEGLVAQHLFAWKDYTSGTHSIQFWRTRSGSEVDFIIFGSLGFWAIEVKNSQTVRSDDVRSLESFLEDYPDAQGILLYRGKERLVKNGIICFPCEAFLRNLKPNQKIDASTNFIN